MTRTGMKRKLAWIVAPALAGGLLWSQRERLTVVGPAPGGGHLLTTGWVVRPAGKQVELSTLPLSAKLTADGKRMLILQSGFLKPSLSLHDTGTGERIASLELDDSFHGLALYGGKAYASGGSTGAIFEVEASGDSLLLERKIGSAGKHPGFLGDVIVSADGAEIYAADILNNTVSVYRRESGELARQFETTAMPYRLLLDPQRGELLVTSWSRGEVIRHAPGSGRILQRLAVGSHTTDMIWQPASNDGKRPRRLIVAASHTNEVAVIGAAADGTLAVSERINVAMTPKMPVGMTPSGLLLDESSGTLYIACSDANSVAVSDLSGGGARVRGFIPVGWYPTALVSLPGGRLAVLNGKGARSYPNPAAPRKDGEQKQVFQHAGKLQMGSLSVIEPFDARQLDTYTQAAITNSPYRDRLLDDAGVPEGNPIPPRPGQPSPIRHVIYIVKENRTYDQVFGDMPGGNGDPSLVLFPEEASINHRKLAREFGLFDNFYVNGDVSADGHNWSSGAISPDMTNKLWPNLYSGRPGRFSLYWGRPPVNHTEEAARPHGGYLWTGAFRKGISVRNYGWMTKLREEAKTGEDQVTAAESKELLAATNRLFRPYDTRYPDVDRMQFFLRDLEEFERTGEMPRLIVMRLGNDHTAGLAPGAFSPRSMFADNDLAFGRLVEAVSKSRFWKDTAIFVLEDDAQAGPDHVDSHRSIAFVISPYAKRRQVDSGFYSTVSMLRTIELILGLDPMTHHDAAARPMYTAFASKADLAPYRAEMPRVSLTERNPERGKLAARSAKLDLSEADLNDDDEMNDLLYLALQGRPAPVPVRSLFDPAAFR
ncbi:MAG: hypothetical protein U0Q16_06290 [Bryobacteraceae bacterium]